MLGLEILLKSLGLTPEVFAQTTQAFQEIAKMAQSMDERLARLNAIEAALHRIEMNTLLILEATGDTVPAGPTDYFGSNRPLDRLPPMEGEIDVGYGNGAGQSG